MRNGIAGTLLLAGILAACSFGQAGSAAEVAEGALRASAAELVGPDTAAVGRLTDAQADEWIALARTRLAAWYDGEPLESHVRGVDNIARYHVDHVGAFVSNVEVTEVDLGAAKARGSATVSFDQAVIRYRTHFTSDAPAAPGVDGVTMCELTVTLLDGKRWRVTEEGCNVSGA